MLLKEEGLSNIPPEYLVKYVRECFRYCEDSGKLYWSDKRPSYHFPNKGMEKSWNTRWRGTEAGFTRPTGYRYVKIRGKSYFAHRLILLMKNGEWPPEYVDHINGDTGDNRLSNIRVISAQDNAKNFKKYKTNKSGYNGIHFWKGYWEAQGQITENGKRRCIKLGRYKEKLDAVKARKDWEDEVGGFTERHGT